MKLTLTLQMKPGSTERAEAEADLNRTIESHCGANATVSSNKPSLGTFQSIDPDTATLIINILNTKAALAISGGLGGALVAWICKWAKVAKLKIGNSNIPLPTSSSRTSQDKLLRDCLKAVEKQLGAKKSPKPPPLLRRGKLKAKK